jgi:ATP-dependent helicase/nuclease subunit A
MSPLPAGASWSDAAQALFRASGAIAVSAAAGAGKTSALVELLRRRLAGDGPEEPLAPRDVVAITFTERAGAELADRLGRELADGARTLRAAGDGDGAARLEEALRELPSMAVGTIHGWAASVLREHALEAGLDPDFAVLDEEGASELLGAASLEGAVAALDRGSAAERRLATALGGVRALGAEAVALLRERATRGLVGAPEAVEGSERDVEAARDDVLAAAADLAGMAAAATTPTGQAALGALAARIAELTGAGRLPDGTALASATRGWRTGKRDPPALSAARARFEEAAARLPLVEAEREAAPLALALASLVGDVERRYREAKDRAGVLDFDDLLLRVRDLLRDTPALRSEMRSRARALLVDEYQDVNGLQAEIFGLLAGEDAPGPAGTPPPLRVAVGDAKQSIYRFRGADVGVFAGLIGRLAAGHGQVVHLRENHRSTGGIVDLVNALLSGEEGGLGVPFGDEDRLLATRPGGDRPAAELLEDEEGGSSEERRAREARAVAARIAELLATGTRPGDVAILFRRLTHVGVFERALREAGIPVRVARGGGFFQAPEVRDLGELCAVVEEPGDEVAWAALLRSPLCSLSDATLFALARRGLSRLSRIDPAAAGAEIGEARSGDAPPGEGDRLRRLLETWRELREGRGRLDAAETISLAVDRLDVEAALLAGPDGERRAANVRKVVEIARRQAARGIPIGTLAERLRTLSRLPPREPEADGGDADAVSLLTVHQAKGLEWPVVVVPELGARPPTPARRPVLDEQGRVAVPLLGDGGAAPGETATTARLRAATSRAERAEGRRLLYVALTRARDRLVLTGSTSRTAAGSWAEVVGRAPPGLLHRRPAPPVPLPLPAPPRPGTTVALVAPALRPTPSPLPLRLSVTSLAEYARCPRRHWLAVQMKLPEPRSDAHGGEEVERATVRGTLAHALLAEVDLLAPPLARRALLAAAATRRGDDPGRPATRRILDDVARFLESPHGHGLAGWARKGALRREIPFLLRLDGAPACYLDGAIDALIESGDGVEVLDFKYARYHPGAEDRYRLQLEAYALAASRAHGGAPVRATLHFLRGVPQAVDVTPSGESLRRLAAQIPSLVLGATRGEGRDLSPGDVGRDEARCRQEGCGFVARCFRTPALRTA